MLVNGNTHGPCVPREALHDLLMATWCGVEEDARYCMACGESVSPAAGPGSCGTAPAACAVVRACIALGMPVKGREEP